MLFTRLKVRQKTTNNKGVVENPGNILAINCMNADSTFHA